MKKRLNEAVRGTLMIIMAFIGMMTFPVWGVVWVITGFNLIDWLSRFGDPEHWAMLDKMNAKTEEMKKYTAKAREDIAKMKEESKAIKARCDKIKEHIK